MNKDAEYYENLDLFGCFGDQGSLEVAIGGDQEKNGKYISY
jgi:hypothetical protein